MSVEAFFRQMSALRAHLVVDLEAYDPADDRHTAILLVEPDEDTIAAAMAILDRLGFPFARTCGPTLAARTVPDAAKLLSLTLGGSDASLAPEAKEQTVECLVALDREGGGSVLRRNGGSRCAIRWLREDESLFRGTVTAIITNYNYGTLLQEAVDSIDGQIVGPDELIIVDDASTDGSGAVLDSLEASGQTVIRNPHNLGIVENFRACVARATSDYVVFLGADNRFRSDFILECRLALDADPRVDIAYTDVLLFGVLAGELARKVGAEPVGHAPAGNWNVYEWRFPDPTSETLASFRTNNFVHGSAMYRRSAYERVGGYKASDGPEDHNLFYRIWSSGGGLAHVALPLLEYRQHTVAQANNLSALQVENLGLKQQIRHLEARYAEIEDGYRRFEVELLRQNVAFAALSADKDHVALAYAEQAETIVALVEQSAELKCVQTAYADQDAELRRIAAAYADQVAELQRVQAAYADQDAELRRVSAAFGDQDAELRRIAAAYADQVAELQRVQAAYATPETGIA